MNTGNRSVVLFSMTIAVLLLAACGAAQPTATTVPPTDPPAPIETPPPPTEAATGITVTFEGDQCVYHGPERIPAGQIPLTLDVRDQSASEKYWVIAYTLDEGKTIEDLRAWKSVGHSPLWVGFHGMLDEQPAGTIEETTIIMFQGPLFLACITEPPGYITDVLGPIEIIPPTSK